MRVTLVALRCRARAAAGGGGGGAAPGRRGGDGAAGPADPPIVVGRDENGLPRNFYIVVSRRKRVGGMISKIFPGPLFFSGQGVFPPENEHIHFFLGYVKITFHTEEVSTSSRAHRWKGRRQQELATAIAELEERYTEVRLNDYQLPPDISLSARLSVCGRRRRPQRLPCAVSSPHQWFEAF